MSQLGPSMTRYTFRSDQTFNLSYTAWFFRISGSGTYRIEDNRLLFATPQKTNTARFSFDGDRLVIREGVDTFHLHKIGDAR